MKNILIGFVFGLVLGLIITAHAASLVGDDGFLMGWDVNMNGEHICSNPWVFQGINVMECGIKWLK